jgi:aspartate kinase
MGINTQWIDVKLHKTDSNYRDATVDWDLTQNISKNVKENIEHYPRIPGF